MKKLLTPNDYYPWGKHKNTKINCLSMQFKNWVINNIKMKDLVSTFDKNALKLFIDAKDWKYIPQQFWLSGYSSNREPNNDTCPSWEDYDGFAPH